MEKEMSARMWWVQDLGFFKDANRGYNKHKVIQELLESIIEMEDAISLQILHITLFGFAFGFESVEVHKSVIKLLGKTLSLVWT